MITEEDYKNLNSRPYCFNKDYYFKQNPDIEDILDMIDNDIIFNSYDCIKYLENLDFIFSNPKFKNNKNAIRFLDLIKNVIKEL
jgi:hypothetical protein